MALLRGRQSVRLQALAETVTRLVIAIAAAGALVLAATALGATSDTWRPNYRIGPVKFNHELPREVDELERRPDGSFTVRPQGGGPIVRGILFEDPNTGRLGARAIWTRSTRIAFRGVRVGIHWRTARARLPGRWTVHRRRGCGWLNSFQLRRDRTGAVSTQLFFRRRTGRIYEIALHEITEIGCSRLIQGARNLSFENGGVR
jgi:hypothetical protein